MRLAFLAPAEVLADEGANVNLLANQLQSFGYVVSRMRDDQFREASRTNDVCFVLYPGLGISTAVLDGAEDYIGEFRVRGADLDSGRLFLLDLPRGPDAVRIVSALGALGGFDKLDLWVGLHPNLLKQGPAYESSLIGDRSALEDTESFEVIDGKYGRAQVSEQQPLVPLLDTYLRKRLGSLPAGSSPSV